MQTQLLARLHRYTSCLILPAFVFAQVVLTAPTVRAADAGITVTGAPVPAAGSTNTNAAAADGTNAVDAASAIDAAMVDEGSNALVQLNFEGADIKTVLLYLSEITGETILPDARVRGGEITIINPKPVTPAQAKQIIFSILESMNFTIVKKEHLINIVPSGDAKTKPIKTLQPPDDVSQMDTEDILRAQVIYPKHVSPKDVETFITPLMSAGAGKVIVNEPTGAVIMIDTGSNIKRLMEIIALIDKVIEGGQVDIKIVQLQYADEKEMSALLNQVFSAPALKAPGAQKVTLGGGAPPGAAASAAPPPPAGATASASAGGGTTELDLRHKADISFIAEPRMHGLIIISPRYHLPLIMDMITRLDVPSTEKDDVVHIYPLQHGKAEDVADTLNDIFSSGDRTERAKSDTKSDEPIRTPTATQPGVTIPRSAPPSSFADRSSSRPSSSASSGTRSLASTSQLAGKVDVIPHKESNSLIIITSPRYYDAVRRIIERLDQRVPQVWIEAIIVEVIRDKTFNLGVGWKDILDHRGSDVSLIQALDTAIGPALNEKGNIPRDNIPGVAYAFGTRDKYGNFDPYFTLQTAEGIVDVNVLSTPSILASNNEKAEISVGKTVPYQNYSTGTDSGTVRDYSYSFLEINVNLGVTPIINKYGEVMMETVVDVNEDGGKSNPDDPSAPPITLSRKATTIVVVQDGQTLVIGGMIKDDFKTTVNKVPILGDIPIIKHAFRSRQETKAKGELLIFITPHVVESWVQGTQLTETTKKRYRGASGFVENSDRKMLYDDLNTARGELSIYDDWREFEKHVDDAEHYFMMNMKDKAGTQPARPTYYFGPEREREREPFQGEIPADDDQPEDETGAMEPVGSADKPRGTMPTLLDREQSLVSGAENE